VRIRGVNKSRKVLLIIQEHDPQPNDGRFSLEVAEEPPSSLYPTKNSKFTMFLMLRTTFNILSSTHSLAKVGLFFLLFAYCAGSFLENYVAASIQPQESDWSIKFLGTYRLPSVDNLVHRSSWLT
jgi:hypothetical protein